jgi:hypothetical protein
MKAKGKVPTEGQTTCSEYSCGTGVLLPATVLGCSIAEDEGHSQITGTLSSDRDKQRAVLGKAANDEDQRAGTAMTAGFEYTLSVPSASSEVTT